MARQEKQQTADPSHPTEPSLGKGAWLVLRRRLLFLLFLLLVLFVLMPWSLRGCDITERPPRLSELAQPVLAPASVISVPITIPLDRLRHLANQEIPTVVAESNEKKRWKKRILGIKASTSARVRYYVHRNQSVRVTGHGDFIRLTVPLDFKGSVKYRGWIRPSTSAKGSADLHADFYITIGEDWQPRLKVKTGYTWNRKPRLDLGLFKVSLADRMGKEIEKKLIKAAQRLEEKANKTWNLRADAEEKWRELHEPRQLRDEPPVWLSTDPQSVFLEPIYSDKKNLYLKFGMTARLATVLGPEPPPAAYKPLPPLQSKSTEASGFAIRLPVLVEYAALQKALNSQLSCEAIQLPAGTVTPSDFEVYTSGVSLALGAHVEGKAPWQLLNSSGRIYLTGRPVYEAETYRLDIHDLNYTNEVDNPLIQTASWMLRDTLLEKLRSRASFDLSEDVAKARQRLAEYINRPLNDGFYLHGDVADINIENIQPLENGLMVNLLARGHLRIDARLPEM